MIVSNTTAQPLNLSGEAVLAEGQGRHPVQGILKPFETAVVELPRGLVKKAAAGAVSLKHQGDKGALLALIHIADEARGYSEAINFADPAQGKTTQLHGAGLRLGKVNNETLKPALAVRNLGNSATVVKTRVPYSKTDGTMNTLNFPALNLAPGEIKLVTVPSAVTNLNDVAAAGLELEYTGAPGSVIATAESVSTSGNHVFSLPLKDPQGGMSSTGGYPWFIMPTASTIVFIKNTTQEPQKFHVTVTYAGGKWGSDLKTIVDPEIWTTKPA